MAEMVMFHDLIDPDDPQGRTYKQVNMEKKHNIALDSLVELESGVRLFVTRQGRDCDMTPLYWLSPDKGTNHNQVGGYTETSLKVIKE